MKSTLILFIFFLFTANLFAEGFEGEIIYEVRAPNGIHRVVLLVQQKYEKMSGMIGEKPFDVYISPDSVVFISPNSSTGLMMSKDSTLVFYKRLLISDTLLDVLPTLKKEQISGFQCTCIEAHFKSGRREELWTTSQIDTDISRVLMAEQCLGPSLAEDPKLFKIPQEHLGEVIISKRTFGPKGKLEFELVVTKIGKRPVTQDEIMRPSAIKIIHVTPQLLTEFIQ